MLFINTINHINHKKTINLCMLNKNDIISKEVRAINVGLSLNLMTKMATDIRYGKNIFDLNLFLLELLLGYYTYGIDRYMDDKIIDNRIYIYDIVYIIIISMLINKTDVLTAFPFELLIYFTKYYKETKIYLNIFKSFYISVLWTISVIILPSVLYDGNFNIIEKPIDFIPYIFLIMATSNYKDINDIEDDYKNNIITIPVKYGIDNAKIFSNFCIIIFAILIFEKMNFYYIL